MATTLTGEEIVGKNVLKNKKNKHLKDCDVYAREIARSLSQSRIEDSLLESDKKIGVDASDLDISGSTLAAPKYLFERAKDIRVEDSELGGKYIFRQNKNTLSYENNVQDGTELIRTHVDARKSILTGSKHALIKDCNGDDWIGAKYVLHEAQDPTICNSTITGSNILNKSEGALIIDSEIVEYGSLLKDAENAVFVNMEPDEYGFRFQEEYVDTDDVEIYEDVPKRFTRQLINDPTERIKVPDNIPDKYRI